MAVAETIKPSSSRKLLAARVRMVKGGRGAQEGVRWLHRHGNKLVRVMCVCTEQHFLVSDHLESGQQLEPLPLTRSHLDSWCRHACLSKTDCGMMEKMEDGVNSEYTADATDSSFCLDPPPSRLGGHRALHRITETPCFRILLTSNFYITASFY